MKKTKTKSIKEDKVVNETSTVETPKEENKLFTVFTKINGIEKTVKTDDIAKAIMAMKPELPKTTLTIRVTKGKVVRDRFLQLQEAKRLYSNEITMLMFIKNLLF